MPPIQIYHHTQTHAKRNKIKKYPREKNPRGRKEQNKWDHLIDYPGRIKTRRALFSSFHARSSAHAGANSVGMKPKRTTFLNERLCFCIAFGKEATREACVNTQVVRLPALSSLTNPAHAGQNLSKKRAPRAARFLATVQNKFNMLPPFPVNSKKMI